MDRPNLVIMWNNVFWKGPRAYYLTGWKPLRWATLPTWPLCKQLFDVLFFLLWFSLPTQIPVIIIISCPWISRRSVHPRLTAYAYERDSGQSERVWNITRGKRISKAASSRQLGILSLKDTLLDLRFDGYVAAAVHPWRTDAVLFGRQQPSKISLSNILGYCAWFGNVIDGRPVLKQHRGVYDIEWHGVKGRA